ncbi:hypothetical protein CV093_12710 [Oceanobacillus sp. 143]|nr:hypothetical protein CV093_12710 [Oceanobacillus sp. 143]
MAKKKQVIIKQNGKVMDRQKHQSTKKTANDNLYQSEQAATVQEADNNDQEIPAIARPKQTNIKQSKKQDGRFRSLRVLLIAIGSAIVIGSVLSYVMFQIFVNVDGNQGHNLV